MSGSRPRRLMQIGTFLLVQGAVLPFLMVVKVLEPSLWLSILSYAGSVGGLTIGLLGLAGEWGQRKEREADTARRQLLGLE